MFCCQETVHFLSPSIPLCNKSTREVIREECKTEFSSKTTMHPPSDRVSSNTRRVCVNNIIITINHRRSLLFRNTSTPSSHSFSAAAAAAMHFVSFSSQALALVMLLQSHAMVAVNADRLVQRHAAFPQHARLHNALAHHPRRQVTGQLPNPSAAEEEGGDALAISTSSTPTSPTTYTRITPSPGAEPIAITRQFQTVTSYVPIMTMCAMPLLNARQVIPPGDGIYTLPPTNVSFSSPSSSVQVPSYSGQIPDTGSRLPHFSNSSSPSSSYSTAPPLPSVSTLTRTVKPYYANTTSAADRLPYYTNTSSSSPVTPSPITDGCSTTYAPTITPICHTTLLGPATAYTVTRCDQALTFSSQYGYRLSLPPGISDPATVVPQSRLPAVETISKYWIAPWTDLTDPGQVPPTVTAKECSTSTVTPSLPTADAPSSSVVASADAIKARATDMPASPTKPIVELHCTDTYEAWQTSLVTSTTTTTSTVAISTTVRGPGMLMVETWSARITETETLFELQSRLVGVVSVEDVSTVMRFLGVGMAEATTTTMEAEATGAAVKGVGSGSGNGSGKEEGEGEERTETVTRTVYPLPVSTPPPPPSSSTSPPSLPRPPPSGFSPPPQIQAAAQPANEQDSPPRPQPPPAGPAGPNQANRQGGQGQQEGQQERTTRLTTTLTTTMTTSLTTTTTLA